MSRGAKSYPWIYRLSHTSWEFVEFWCFFYINFIISSNCSFLVFFFQPFSTSKFKYQTFKIYFLWESLLPVVCRNLMLPKIRSRKLSYCVNWKNHFWGNTVLRIDVSQSRTLEASQKLILRVENIMSFRDSILGSIDFPQFYW